MGCSWSYTIRGFFFWAPKDSLSLVLYNQEILVYAPMYSLSLGLIQLGHFHLGSYEQFVLGLIQLSDIFSIVQWIVCPWSDTKRRLFFYAPMNRLFLVLYNQVIFLLGSKGCPWSYTIRRCFFSCSCG